MTETTLERPVAPWRRRFALVTATVSPLAAAMVLLSFLGSAHAAILVPTGLLVLSAWLAHRPGSGSQILARSVWWANLVLGVLLSLAGGETEKSLGLLIVLTTSAPLLAMGHMGLDSEEESAFRPIAFRTALTLGMMMAVADAQALLFWGAYKIDSQKGASDVLSSTNQGVILLLAAAMIGVAIAGLYRLRLWGLLFAGLCAAGLAGLAATNVCGLRDALARAFIATSVVQLLLTVPVVAAVIRGRAPAPRPPSRLARIAPALAVVLLAASAVVAQYVDL
jgi:hypothetical protein